MVRLSPELVILVSFFVDDTLVTKKEDYFKILCWLHGSGGPGMLRGDPSVCPDWQRPGMFKFFLAM
jgi:hypothetical protein